MPNPIKILKNNTASIVFITDTGISVPASGSYTIPHQEYLLFAASSDVITYVSDFAVDPSTSTLTVNDGADDLSISDGVDLLKGIFKRTIVTGNPSGNEMEVTDDQRGQTEAIVAGYDGLNAFRRVNTKVRSDGLKALVTDATVVVESTFGFDQQPDSFFRIIDTGGAGTTWTLDIAGTSNDPSTPDRDLPAYQRIFTVQAGEVGDEIAFRDRIIQELNQDTVFRQTCQLKSQNATDRAVVHIYSEAFSASGEFYERPNSGDFAVTIGGTPGDGIVVVGFDNIISRSKPVTITRDFDSPHRLGLFGITGNVNVTQKALSDLYFKEATYLGSPDMRVDGSITPVPFRVSADPATDIFVENLIFHAQGNGIKFGQFLNKNQKLANGLQLSIKSDDIITTFPLYKSTEDIKNDFAALSGDGANFRIDVQAGADEILAILRFQNPFLIRVAGTFTIDDYIEVLVQDDLSSGIAELHFQVKGFEKEP